MRNIIRPLLIVALFAAYSLTCYAAPTKQQLLRAYGKVPAVQRALQARADIMDAFQASLDSVRLAAQLKIGVIDRKIDALLVRIHKAQQAKKQQAKTPRKPKVGRKVPKEGKAVGK